MQTKECEAPADRFESAVFSGGGCRCFWQAGFWSVAAPALDLRPRVVGATSAGAAIACAAVAGAIDVVLKDFKRRAEINPGNLRLTNLGRGEPIFPHEQMYREAIREVMTPDVLARLREGPEVRVLLARPPLRLGPRTGVLVGALAYELDLASGGRAHSTWGRRFGFRPEVVSVRSCRSADELADLILQSSCTPPLTPLYRRGGEVVLDGGLVDKTPAEIVEGYSPTLILLTSPLPGSRLPRIPGRTYVRPSRRIPVAKWDYTSPELLQQTFDLGRRDGEAFARERFASA